MDPPFYPPTYRLINAKRRKARITRGRGTVASRGRLPAAAPLRSLDTLTHTLLGIHLSRLTPFRGVPERVAVWTCVAAANAPDLEMLGSLGGGTSWLFGQQGLNHSLLFAALAAPLIGLGAGLSSRRSLRGLLPALIGVAVAGLAGHLVLDGFTSVGVPLLAPFSPARFSLPWLFPVDGWLWVILGLPLLWGAWKRRRGPIPERALARLSAASLVALSLYVTSCSLARERARFAALAHLPEGVGVAQEVLAFPAPYGPLIWTTLVRTDEQLWVRGFASVLTGGVSPGGTFSTGREDPRVQIALETEVGRRYGWYAQALYRAGATELSDDGSYEVALGDLRFSDPFSDTLPKVLWMRIGPHFEVEDHEVRSAILPR